MTIFVTSDLHIGHNKAFLYEPRGFTNIIDHDNAIIENWNQVVCEQDLVYILGDLILNDIEYGMKIFNQLNGDKIIILGNHDTDAKIDVYRQLKGVIDIKDADRLRVGKRNFLFTHYPMKVGKRDYLFNLCGHTHTNDKWADWENDNIYHVELNAHMMTPIALEKIIQDIQLKQRGNIKC